MWPKHDTKGEKKPEMTIKDWLATTIACLALLVSAGTAYLNNIRQTDDLKVVPGDVPETTIFQESGSRLRVRSGGYLTFINSGSRTVAITKIDMQVIQANVSQQHIEVEKVSKAPQA
jgi:hypothetical protein